MGVDSVADLRDLDPRPVRKGLTVVGERIIHELRGTPCLPLELVPARRKGCAVKRAATGKSRSDTTQRTIEDLAARVAEGAEAFRQIVASTNQQQLGIEQVIGALQNIRQASQQTAAGTREVETASVTLTELASGLLSLADRYRVAPA